MILAVLPYFAESDFFDKTSNNAALSAQAFANPNMFYLIQTREAFEGRLKTMQGVEFMVTHDPSENDKKLDHNGVWVIGKQSRRKRPGMEDEITPLGKYYVVGINVFMAPSIGNIIGSRMVCALIECRETRQYIGLTWPLAFECHIPYEITLKSVHPPELYSSNRLYLSL